MPAGRPREEGAVSAAAMPHLPAEDLYGSTLISARHVQALVRAAEAALELRHSAQFFVWSQGSVQLLLPHELLLCGAYQRSCRELRFELFNNVPLPGGLRPALLAPGCALLPRLQALWLEAGCRPRAVTLDELPADEPGATLLAAAGYRQLLVHGLSRPQRPAELESFFVLAHGSQPYTAQQQVLLALLLPHLHGGWQRVQAAAPSPAAVALGGGPAAATGLTERECEVLRGLREGLSNQQIGERLDISALTVKNHVQRILRKLGASNRAHAVARALALKLLDGAF